MSPMARRCWLCSRSTPRRTCAPIHRRRSQPRAPAATSAPAAGQWRWQARRPAARPLGGILGGAAPDGAQRGLGGLLEQLQRGGQGDVARSWVGPGANKTIAEDDLASALGGDTLATLAYQTGMGRDDLLSGLSRHLPRFVDELTPDGRLPTEEEAGRWV
jgi:uncharacterized protein YidB (DUF937 family)